MSHRIQRFLTIALVALTLAACGGDGGAPPTTPDGEGGAPTAPTIPAGWGRGEIAGVTGTEVAVTDSSVELGIEGELPTPCHVPIWEVSRSGSTVEVSLFSAVDPGEMCAQVLEPFDVAIPLGSFEPGEYEILLNGERVGEFRA